MYARMSRFAGLPPERIDETLKGFERGQLPVFEQQSGYKGVTILVDRGEGKAAAITYWETLEDLRASDRVANQARDSAVQTAEPGREPLVDRYEVLLQR